MRKATASEQDKLEFYSNKQTSVPRVYRLFGLSGVTFLAIVLLLAAWFSVFFKELQSVLFPVFVISWRVGVLYTILTGIVYVGIWLWYRYKHVPYNVCIVYCKDIQQGGIDEDNLVYVFVSEHNEQFTMLKSQFAYIPVSFSVQLYYLLAFDTLNEQYLIYQYEEYDDEE